MPLRGAVGVGPASWPTLDASHCSAAAHASAFRIGRSTMATEQVQISVLRKVRKDKYKYKYKDKLRDFDASEEVKFGSIDQ